MCTGALLWLVIAYADTPVGGVIIFALWCWNIVAGKGKAEIPALGAGVVAGAGEIEETTGGLELTDYLG